MSSPREAYESRLASRRAALEAHSGRASTLSNVRLATFAAIVGAGGLLLWMEDLPGRWILGVPVALFVGAVLLHRAAAAARGRTARAVAFYERGIARLEHRFRGTGATGEEFASDDHPYAAQLDLFGPGALFELMSGARTHAGRECLAGWLLEPAPPDEIRARHEALREVEPRLDLREELAVLGGEASDAVEGGSLRAWATGASDPASGGLRIALAGLAAANAAAIASWAALGTSLAPLALLALVEIGIWLGCRTRVRAAVDAVDRTTAQLPVLVGLLERLERERFESERLARLLGALGTGSTLASRRLKGLQVRVDLLESRRNQMFAPIAPLLLWTTQLAFEIEAWRAAHAAELAGWIDAIAEIEALLDLGAYAFEHPEDPLPDLEESGACFVGEAVGHPLIPDDRCVRNDVRLDGELRLWVVSGSNMSGKSTLMRSVGINAVLALAGAPVRARSLRISPLAVGASFRVLDSLQEGVSHFQAEVLRVRLVAGLAGGAPPLLFLLDEIFQGTNSHDRVHGATAIVRGLVERGSIGMVSTHDLKLADIVDALGGRARNVHFEDAFDDGEMTFDYRLRDGVVERSNAVALMRAVGLEV